MEITVIAGELGGHTPPPPPPHSWAARADADVAIWHAQFDPGGRWTMPPARSSDTVRTLYVFDGSGLSVDGHALEDHGAVVTADAPVELVAEAGAVELLVLQGRPIGEPVAQYGPFVMNTRGRDRARRSTTTSAPSSAGGRGRPTIRPTVRARRGSPATPTVGSKRSSRSEPPARQAAVANSTSVAHAVRMRRTGRDVAM